MNPFEQCSKPLLSCVNACQLIVYGRTVTGCCLQTSHFKSSADNSAGSSKETHRRPPGCLITGLATLWPHQKFDGLFSTNWMGCLSCLIMWAKQCHKLPMTGNGKHTIYRSGDDGGMVYYCFTQN